MRTTASGTPAHTLNSPRFAPQPAQADCDLARTAWPAIMSAHNATNLAYSCFSDLATLFQAIADVSEKHSQAAKLAKIGLYLAEDWSNLHDSERESLEPYMDALRAALGFSPIPNEGGAK